jgi:hypothetical protein
VELFAWVGLVVSWLMLALILKFLLVVLRILKNIRRLAEMSRDTAVALAVNVADDEGFAQAATLAEQLPRAVQPLATGADLPVPYTSSVSPGIGGRFS